MSTDYFVRCFACHENASGDNLRYPPALFRVIALAKAIAECPETVYRARAIFREDGTTAGFAGPGGDTIAPLAWLLEHAQHDLGVVDEYGVRCVNVEGSFADVVARYNALAMRHEADAVQVRRNLDHYIQTKGPKP